MKFKIALQSDIGLVKETNQDSCFVKEAVTDKGTVLMAAICDGMGGLSKGELASATLVKVFLEWFEKELPDILSMNDPLDEVHYQWNRMMKEQNSKIAAYGKSLRIQLGSTITMMLILENNKYIIGHVGDSRVYRITDSNVEILTEDQTLVAREVKQGRLSPQQAKEDPRRNVLLQCIGASKLVEPVFYFGTVEHNECYMLCSDGFRHEIGVDEMLNAFAPSKNNSEEEMEHQINMLIELNKHREESDNITSILLKCSQEV